MVNKFQYVRGAKLDPDNCHECAWPDCAMQIPRELFMCADHWNTLPKLIRHRIWNAFEPGECSTEYLDALSEAKLWAETYLRANAARSRPA